MFCVKCGSKLNEGSKFCVNCGNQIDGDVSNTVSSDTLNTLQSNIGVPVNNTVQMDNPVKTSNSNKTLFIILGSVLGFLLLVGVGFIAMGGLFTNHTDLANTSWTAGDDSLMIFEDSSNFIWYRYPDELSDNYRTGEYEFYVGEEAIDYLVNDASELGVTRDEVDRLFSSYGEEAPFVFLVLKNGTLLYEGEFTEYDSDNIMYYMGQLLYDGTVLELMELETFGTTTFTKED